MLSYPRTSSAEHESDTVQLSSTDTRQATKTENFRQNSKNAHSCDLVAYAYLNTLKLCKQVAQQLDLSLSQILTLKQTTKHQT